MTNSSTIVSKPKVAAASRRWVLASRLHSTATPTPASVSQTHNVRKCPVLSGPTDRSREIDASTDNQTTCAQNPSHPYRTSVGSAPLPTSRPPSRSPSPSPSGCRRSVAMTWPPILRAASCLRVFVVRWENQKVPPSPHNPQCPEMSGFVRSFRPDRIYNRKHRQHNDLPRKTILPRPDIRRKFTPQLRVRPRDLLRPPHADAAVQSSWRGERFFVLLRAFVSLC